VPNTSTYVLSSYSVDGGPTTIFNATEMATYQFQQKLFESARLTDSGTHTIVVTLVNNGSFFIDYFLIIPSVTGATSISASSSNPTSLTGTTTVAGASAQPHSSRVSLASSESSNPSSLTGTTMTVGGANSPTLSSTTVTAGAGAQSHPSRVSLGPAVGGALGGLVLLIIAILAIFLCFKRRKDKNQMRASE
jgi:hypothetical protein